VDQAFALSVHDVDSLAKYDWHLQEDGMSVVACSKSTGDEIVKVDALTKERIFHYQTKIAAAKLTPKRKSNSSEEPSTPPSRVLQVPSVSTGVSPPANLVEALRRVFDEAESPLSKLTVDTSSNSLFELRHLLQAVSTHTGFPGSVATDERSRVGVAHGQDGRGKDVAAQRARTR
jgi:hypothetical protein